MKAKELRRVSEFLFHEAQLLDRREHRAWLDLYAPDAIYWIPLLENYGDPESELNIIYDDRARLVGRIERLESGVAYAQEPPSRTARIVGNITATRSAGGFATEATFVCYELRNGETQLLAGRYLHDLVDGPELRIRRKTIELVTRTEHLVGLTFLL